MTPEMRTGILPLSLDPGNKTWLQGCLSIRARLAIVFSSLVTAAILFSTLLLIKQHRIAMLGADRAILSHNRMVNAVELRESLRTIDKQFRVDRIDTPEIERFDNLLRAREAVGSDSMGEAPSAVEILRRRFRVYVDALLANPAIPGARRAAQIAYEDVAAEVGAVIGLNQNAVYHRAEELRSEQIRAMRLALPILLAFIVAAMIVGLKFISMVTKPLSSLARFLDDFDMRAELPQSGPEFDSRLPEVHHMAKSMDRFLRKFSGYKALGVRRLLEEKYRADLIASSIADGVFLLQGDRVVYLNPIAEKILNLRPGEGARGLELTALLRRSPAHIGASGTRGSGTKAVLEAISRSIPVEFSLQEESGRNHYLIRSQPVSPEHLKGAGAAGDGRDEATATTLVVAQDVTLLRESQEAKGHFLATLSHEIKTPVTSLTMATRLLQKSAGQLANPTHQVLVHTCAEDVDRLRSLLQDLLSISSFDTLTQRLEVQHVDLRRLLQQSIESIRDQARERGIEIVKDLFSSPGACIVAMDPTKIAWAVSNLLTNALRHSPREGKITVGLYASEGWVEIRIRDSGPGIDRTRQARIFEKFNPFYDLRVARSGSAGVGLAIAREIVVAHRGRIWVSSAPGEGAEFCFTLPLKKVEARTPERTHVRLRDPQDPNNPATSIETATGLSEKTLKKGAPGGASACSG